MLHGTENPRQTEEAPPVEPASASKPPQPRRTFFMACNVKRPLSHPRYGYSPGAWLASNSRAQPRGLATKLGALDVSHIK
jgi:hypothetical protein